ncbi:sensor histidine kinase [Bdellovibrio bacteriovorus]|uniref:histidine kinase n=1 Tax=Bdellovibrio bacteriovorus str. Tiberius TaxID=1069642 RepID=K7ZCL2_BDEBC|nr:ATP-binding protein [Bdellovibrio bacteriovorus]AFY03309.1 serine/threonine kinase protein [Bdellovibrio bacteriovorus str. Tiberius]
MDYQRDFDKLQNNFTIIKNSYLDSMAEHLWSYDTRLLEIQLDGLGRLQGVSYLRLVADNKTIYETGKSDPTEESHKRFDIYHKNTNEILGALDVELDIKSLREKYFQEAIWIFIRQAAKTAVVVFFLYFIFNRILVVHIKHIAGYLAENRGRDAKDLELKRRAHKGQDELDVLVESINQFRSELLEANQKLESLNQALEQKVAERTRQLTTKNESLEKAMMQIKRMQATLVAQERLASLGSLTASVAHEIRNPLNFVLNFSELLTDSENLEEIKEISRVILKHSQRIDQIVRSMQILSGYDSDVLEVTDINEIVKKSYQDTVSTRSLGSSYVPPKVTYRLGESVKAPVYTTSLLRALSNIVDNAIHALEKKVRANKNFEPELILSTAVRGDMVEITIRDNGVGIPTILGEKIFDPFLTTKSAGEGAGLGLTVAFNIAQKHGGTLKYNSEFGQWTEFSMSLPLTHERPNS